MTIVEKILLAAHALEESGKMPFTAEQLIVRAWETDKGLFGLQGYDDKHPDSNRILTNIMGSKGLKGKGWIERVGEKQYRLTATGSRVARGLASASPESTPRATMIDRKHIAVLERMINSPAFKKASSKGEGLIFRDACNFWGISSYSKGAALRNQFTDVRDVLEEFKKAISDSPSSSVLLPGMTTTIDRPTLQALRETHEDLQRRFFNELEVIRSRS